MSRYLIVTNNGTVVDKHCMAGDDDKITAATDSLQKSDVGLVVQEVDETTFNATPMDDPVTDEQKSWQAIKPGDTQAAISFIAKKLGLE